MRTSTSNRRRGGALLAVLWLTAALSAIAFAVASTVRGESERASTLAERIRGEYLAAGAIERAILRIESDGFTRSPSPLMRYSFPGGEAVVEVIPETARLSLNTGRAEEFAALAVALGAEPARALDIAAAIVDWRGPGGAFDPYYSSLVPSFRARHASFQEVEEVLWVKGMTPELFHGNWVRDPQGRLVRLGAFKECVSVVGTSGSFDVNTAEPALLQSLGIPREAVQMLVDYRRRKRIESLAEIGSLAGSALARLRTGGNTIYELRATARPRLQDGRLAETSRTVAAQIKFKRPGEWPPHEVLRWRAEAYSEVSQWR